ncbi:MAG TPA: DNA repair protein RecO [Planctomycetota bacterium]|nr:DNA repair protein RecO [Planctomycetota bacterium]
MASRKTHAITLRLVDYRETSQILSVYSRDFGRLSLIAKGSKRRRRGTGQTIDLFQLIEVVFIERTGSGLQLLTESSLLDDFAGLRRDLRRGYAAFFVAELLGTLTEENDPNAALFELTHRTLTMLCETDRPNVVLHTFEIRLLTLIGLLPRLDACAWCGGELGTEEEVAFAAGAGGTICRKCTGSVPDMIYVSRGALTVLNKLAGTAPIKVERLRISGTIAKDVRKMLARLWMHTMGREPHMLKYLR